jgi:Zn-dependent protease
LNLKALGFSKIEIRDILLSSAILAFVFYYPGIGRFFTDVFSGNIIIGFLFYFLILTSAFVPHELAHKFVAMKYGAIAKYQMWKAGLMWAAVIAFFTNGMFTFAAPGAVVIYTTFRDSLGTRQIRINEKQNAYISMAGPITNFVVAALMIPLLSTGSIFKSIFYVNAFIGLFNLIPIPPFDGSKIIKWNKNYYFVLVAIGFIMTFMV